MKRGSIAGRLGVATATAASLWCGACSFLSPAGDGGWDPGRRAEELARARAMVAPAAETPAASTSAAPAAAPSPSPAIRTIDLQAALDLAARHNRDIAAAAEAVSMAAGDVAVARAALLPTNSVRGAYNWYSDAQTSSVDIDPNLLPPGSAIPVVTVRQQDFATVNAAVRLAIDLSGEFRHGLDAAQASYRAEEARQWATTLSAQRDVTAAYFGLLEAERLREVGAQTIALYERQLADATSKYDAGRLTRNGVLVVDVALSDARQTMMRLENSVSASRRELCRVTGLDVDTAVEARDVAARPPLPPVDEAVAEATTKNPLVGAMLEEVQATDERLTAARRSRFPRFSTGAAYDATTADTLKPNDYASVTAGVEWDLGSFAREGQIAKLDAASRRSRLLLDRSVREVTSLVRDSHDRVRERLAAIDTAEVATRQAEENLRIRQAQFDEGRATSEDLLDASQLLVRQKAMLASALYQAYARRAELQQLMGDPLSELATAPAAAPAAPTPAAARTSASSRPEEDRR